MARPKKTAAVKTSAETVKETAAVVETATKETKPARKTAAKVTVAENIVIQQNGCEISTAVIAEKAKAESGVKSPKNINVYIKPEENMVYYVIDEVSGSFTLC